MRNDKLKETIKNIDTVSSFAEKKVSTFEKKHGKKGTVLLVAIIVLVLVLCGTFWKGIVSSGARFALSQYNLSKNDTQITSEKDAYNIAYDYALKKYQATNNVFISIDSIKETANLQVMAVVERVLETQTKEEETSGWLGIGGVKYWIVYEGTGVYSVNLQLGEFIIDNERNYVLARLPQPQLTLTLNNDEEKLLINTRDGIIVNGAETGATISRNARFRAYDEMWNSLSRNQEYMKAAKDNTRYQIEQLIRALNPNIKELKVEVLFFDE